MPAAESCLSYQSVKLIKVNNTKLALLYYITLILILTYVVVYSVVLSKGYQAYDPVVSSSMLKVKGAGVTESGMVFDSYDLVKPAVLPDTVFVGTNYVLTPNQTRSTCEGNDKGSELCNCTLGSIEACCRAGELTDNGVKTGECWPGGEYCTIKGWCPLEVKTNNLIDGVQNWTLMARVNARFAQFGVSRSNTEDNPGEPPLYVMGEMARATTDKEGNHYTWEDYAVKGGMILADFHYDCDLNRGVDKCKPETSFTRLDDPNDLVSSGFNFRYVDSYRNPATGEQIRDLWKMYGVYVVFQVTGQAGRFDLATLVVTLGAGIALLSVATVVCDVVMQYLLPNRKKYNHEKFTDVEDTLSIMGSPRQHSEYLAPVSVNEDKAFQERESI